MQVRTVLLVVAAVAGGAAPARGDVSLKNGNFYVGYTDLSYSGGFELAIERVYNSKSSFSGMFGFGWGCDWDVYLEPMPDRSVVVHENGGGAFNAFYPTDYGAADLTAGIDAVVAATARGRRWGVREAEDYRARIAGDARARQEDWGTALARGWAQFPVLAAGLELVSDQFGHQVIRATATGFERVRDDGKTESYDRRGRLVRMRDRNDNWVDVGHDAAGHAVSIVDNLGRTIALRYDRAGRVIEVRGDHGRRATYRYDPRGALVDMTDDEGGRYRYRYDDRFNLTRIDDPDGSYQEIGYYPLDRGERVRRRRDGDGTVHVYSYAEQADGLVYTTGVEGFGDDGRRLFRNRYDYHERIEADGSRRLLRLVSDEDGDRTDTTYTAGGMPARIERNGEVTRFEYDDHGHVTLKETPTETTRLAYDARFAKVSRVDELRRGSSKASWAEYRYDDRANLIHAADSDGRRVELTYDAGGHIATLTDETGSTLRFRYNSDARPVEITKDGVGTLTVEYNAAGDIKKVDSSGGRKISLEVSSAFQRLQDLVRPAGVNLSF